MKVCEHFNFVTSFDVHRCAEIPGGEIKQFRLSGNVICYDCGMEFRPFDIILVPTGKIDARRPQLTSSAAN